MATDPSLSVVVPLLDEEPNVAPLVEAVRTALGGRRWELLLVDDGSTDGTAEAARTARRNDPRVRLVRLARTCGQATAMQAGFERARGRVVVSLDGDLQNDPRDIPRLLDRLEEGYDLVAGYRADRRDGFLTRVLPSRLANALIRWATGTPLRDNGCTLRAYRRDVLERMHLYSGMHRFVAPLATGTVGARTAEVRVRHHPRRHGSSKYGLSRTWQVLADLLTVKTLRSFRERPLVLYGMLAGALLGGAAAFAAFALAATGGAAASATAGFVLPSASLLCLQVAVFLLMLGLTAEVVLRSRWHRRRLAGAVAREWGVDG